MTWNSRLLSGVAMKPPSPPAWQLLQRWLLFAVMLPHASDMSAASKLFFVMHADHAAITRWLAADGVSPPPVPEPVPEPEPVPLPVPPPFCSMTSWLSQSVILLV